jgi:peptidoglycan/LPS O-acetylase OafA/YrhL
MAAVYWALQLCVLFLSSTVSSVRIAPWIPSQDATEWINSAVTADLSDESRRALAVAARKIPAAVSDGFRRLFTEEIVSTAAVAAYDSQCLSDFSELMLIPGDNLFGASKGIEVIDAMGKPGADLLYGGFTFMAGSFDECLNIGERVKFWSAPITAYIVIKPPPNPTLVPIGIRYGMCVPVSCDSEDFQYFINQSNAFILQYEQTFFLEGDFSQVVETKSRTTPLTTGAIIMITVCCIFLALAIFGTVADVGVKILKEFSKKLNGSSINRNPAIDPEESSPLLGQPSKRHAAHRGGIFFEMFNPLEFITAFSVFKNVGMILSTKQPPTAITSLNGIRVISMGWVILGHTFLWCYGITSNPLYVVTNVASRFSAQPIVNGYFSVDSFFFLSGTLVAYLTLREMERKKGRFPVITYYLHRYLRLTMVYAFLLFFWWTLTVHLGNGPTWRKAAGVDSDLQNNCEKYWWTNFLYINNLYPWGLKDECMGWTWYLSNDMQFYILAPLIVIPLYFFFPAGLLISGVLIIVTIVANGAIAGVKGFQANMFQDHSGGENNDIYIKPYTRAGPYIVGLVLGYILFKKVRINIHWLADWLIYRVVLTVAGGCLFSTLYGLYSSWGRGGISLAENVSYFMFSRFVWAFGLALLVFACHNGYGRAINAFLSMGFWVPLSRLTYTAYLFHPIILTVVFNTLREPFTYSDYILTVYGIAMVVLSFGAAGVVAVFVEFPLSNLEMAVFKAAGLKLRESTRNVESQKKGVRLEARNSKPTSPINEGSKA